MKRALALVAAALVLAGCGHWSAPTSGTVYNKQYFASYQWMSYDCFAYNSRGYCTFHMYTVHTEPAHWKLCLSATDENGKPWQGCRDVDQIDFHQYNVGDYYPRQAQR